MSEWCHTFKESCRTHMNESCHTHDESCHTHMNESWHTHPNESCYTHMNVSSHADMNGSCSTHVSEMFLTHMNESWRNRKRHVHEVSHSHITHMKESYHTYEWVNSHIWMSHITHMNESYHTHEWVMEHEHTRTRRGCWEYYYYFDYKSRFKCTCWSLLSFTCVTWLVHAHDTAHSCAWHTWFSQLSVWYGVALVSRIDKIIGLSCKRAL